MTDDSSSAPQGQIIVGDDGIVRFSYLPGTDITLRDAHYAIASVDRIAEGTSVPVCVDMRQVRSTTHESRKYFASDAAARHINAVALIVDSPISRVLGNFFMGINKPQVPTKMFTSEPEAIAWLKEFLL